MLMSAPEHPQPRDLLHVLHWKKVVPLSSSSSASIDPTFPAIHVSMPREIGCYTKLHDGRFLYGSRKGLRDFKPPGKFPLDLNPGFMEHNLASKKRSQCSSSPSSTPTGHSPSSDHRRQRKQYPHSPSAGVPVVTVENGVEPVVETALALGWDIPSQVDFVTFRNNMNKIGMTPYAMRDSWELDAAMVGQVVFLDIRKTNEEPEQGSALARFQYYGYKFESLCCTKRRHYKDGETAIRVKPEESAALVNPTAAREQKLDEVSEDGQDKHDVGVGVDSSLSEEEFCSVSRIRIGNHRILIGCEIDGADPTNISDDPLQTYIELKTLRDPSSQKAWANIVRFKFVKFWLQSYLGGIRNVFVGFRDDDGYIVRCQMFKTSDLPKQVTGDDMARNGHIEGSGRGRGRGGGMEMRHVSVTYSPVSVAPWDPFCCLNFINDYLDVVKSQCAANPGQTIRFVYHPEGAKVTAALQPSSEIDIATRIKKLLSRGK